MCVGRMVVEGKEINIRDIVSSFFLYSNQADTSTKFINSESCHMSELCGKFLTFPLNPSILSTALF